MKVSRLEFVCFNAAAPLHSRELQLAKKTQQLDEKLKFQIQSGKTYQQLITHTNTHETS